MFDNIDCVSNENIMFNLFATKSLDIIGYSG